MLVLTLTEMFNMAGGKYSILSDNGNFEMWIMEREWKFNRRNVSCVPRDEYVLERHNGKKYKNTYALIGDGVGHLPQEDKPRYACVIHRAVFPTELQGCLAPAESIDASGHTLRSEEATLRLLTFLDLYETEGIKILYQ